MRQRASDMITSENGTPDPRQTSNAGRFEVLLHEALLPCPARVDDDLRSSQCTMVPTRCCCSFSARVVSGSSRSRPTPRRLKRRSQLRMSMRSRSRQTLRLLSARSQLRVSMRSRYRQTLRLLCWRHAEQCSSPEEFGATTMEK